MSDQILSQKLKYRDFRIEITEPKDAPGTYLSRAVEVPDHDPMRSDEAEPVPYKEGDLDDSIARLESRMLKANRLIPFWRDAGQPAAAWQARAAVSEQSGSPQAG